MTGSGKQPLHVILTTDGHQWWHDTAHTIGSTVTGLVQAIADRGDTSWIDDELAEEARQIDVQRRLRPHLQTITRGKASRDDS